MTSIASPASPLTAGSLTQLTLSLLAIVGLRYEKIFNIAAKLLCIEAVESMFRINKGSNAARPLSIGNGMNGKGSLTG